MQVWRGDVRSFNKYQVRSYFQDSIEAMTKEEAAKLQEFSERSAPFEELCQVFEKAEKEYDVKKKGLIGNTQLVANSPHLSPDM